MTTLCAWEHITPLQGSYLNYGLKRFFKSFERPRRKCRSSASNKEMQVGWSAAVSAAEPAVGFSTKASDCGTHVSRCRPCPLCEACARLRVTRGLSRSPRLQPPGQGGSAPSSPASVTGASIFSLLHAMGCWLSPGTSASRWFCCAISRAVAK